MAYAHDVPPRSDSDDLGVHSFVESAFSPRNRSFLLVFASIGLLYISSKIFSFLRLLLSLFVLPGKSLTAFAPSRRPSQSWALITGCTDGIGLEFATQLAQAGYNIVLVSRTESKLASVARTLNLRFPKCQTKTLAIDFSAAAEKDYTALSSSIADLDVGILINNVGKSHDIPVPFAQTEQAEMDGIVGVNVAATLRVTAVVLPGMMTRRRGLILTMGSFGGLIPTSLLATYSGSKAFLQQWSSALGAELAPHGVTVELVQSYLVTSAMSKVRRPSMLVPTPKAFVRSTLAKIGRSGGAQGFAYTSTPWWSHAFMQWAIGTVTGFMGTFVVGQNKSMHETIRKRALRKQQRDAGKKAR